MARTPRLLIAAATLAGAPAGAADQAPATCTTAPAAGAWKRVATAADRKRIQDVRDTWIAALAEARPAHGAALAADGALFDPDAALAEPSVPAGTYQCRTVKLGARKPGAATWLSYPSVPCRFGATGDEQRVRVTTGTQRPDGRLYADDGARLVFLGTLVLGDERNPLGHGVDAERDLAGVVERIGPARWRLVLPRPAWQSTLDVIEITPAG